MKRFPIVKNAKIFFSITIIFLLVGFGSMIMKGFNLGIDFTGGNNKYRKSIFSNEICQERQEIG